MFKLIFGGSASTVKTVAIVLVAVIFFAGVSSSAASKVESVDKQKVLSKLAQEFLQIGQEQYRRGLYTAAENSLLRASENRQYLSTVQQERLTALLAKTQADLAERAKVLQEIESAKKLAEAKDFLRAQKRLINIENSTYLTDSERARVAAELKTIERQLIEEKKRIKQLNRESIQFYREGRLETARRGFEMVAMSNLLVETEDDSPEDYLVKIDTQIKEAGAAKVQAKQASMAVESELVIERELQAEEQGVVAVGQTEAQASYIDKIMQKRNIQRSYTTAVVNDSIARAVKLADQGNFEQALTSLDRAIALVKRNRLLLGDELFKQFDGKLTQLREQIVQQQYQAQKQSEEQKQVEAENLQQKLRSQQETDRQQRIKDLMQSAMAFQKQQRYDDALGALELILTLEPLNNRALSMKQMLEDINNFRRQLEVRKELEKRELDLLHEVAKSTIPYPNAMTFPKDWREISSKRAPEEMAGLNPADAAVYKQLDDMVDLTELTPETEFTDALQILRGSVDPSLKIVALWRDLYDNAYIERSTPINFDGVSQIPLKKGLSLLLESVSGGLVDLGYVVEDGVITIATTEALPSNMVTRIYDVTELLGAPADFASDSGGGGGTGGGGGGGTGGGGNLTSDTDEGGIEETAERAESIIESIQDTIEPDSWYAAGGEGRIRPFGEPPTKLLVLQTPENHRKIRDLVDELSQSLGQQVSIEARFLLVSENFMEDIGLDVDFQYNAGGKIGLMNFQQQHSGSVKPTNTEITGSLGSMATSMIASGGYGSILDDLQVSFLLRATQAHRNARAMTAPRVTVLSGERAAIRIERFQEYASDWDIEVEEIEFAGTTIPRWTVSVETEELVTGTVLNITPTITADKKYVLLLISTWVTEFLGWESLTFFFQGQELDQAWRLPETETSEVATRVMVPDRGTLLLGGQKLTVEDERESGVPVLSKLPIIGRAFRNRSVIKDEKILLILVTPTIILKEEVEHEAFPTLR